MQVKETAFQKARGILWWLPVSALLLVTVSLLVMMIPGGLAKVRAWFLLQLIPPILGLLILVVVGLYVIVRRRFSRIIRVTLLASLISIAPAIQMFVPIVPYPASLTETKPSATVRLPANGPLKIIWGGDNLIVNFAHIRMPNQRWAYDIAVEPVLTGSTRLTDYGCYGVPVVAPATGVVVTAHDGEPDAIPGTPSNNFKEPEGNFVAIRRAETGTYLILAHLKPESIRVSVGETVTEGQIIAQCGNSGNTSEPHIHIHHQRQDPNQYKFGFAEGLPLFFRDQTGPLMPTGGLKWKNGKWIAIGDTVQNISK